jgi:hypothetical protein
MSEFDKLKDEAEKEMTEHPEQVKEGQQAVEEKLARTASTYRHDHGNAPQGDQAGQS